MSKTTLTKEQIEANANHFLELIGSIKIEGADIERLQQWLLHSDFFIAPASTKYHCNFEGGLCLHSLNVYNILVKLVKQFATHKEPNPDYIPATETSTAQGEEFIDVPNYTDDDLKVVALLHDISKANYYERFERNVNTGEKDEKGKDIWVKVPDYKVKEQTDRFIFGSHEQNSEFMVHTFFPLTIEQSAALLHHHGGMSFDSGKDLNVISAVYGRFALATLLHVADVMATFLLENE